MKILKVIISHIIVFEIVENELSVSILLSICVYIYIYIWIYEWMCDWMQYVCPLCVGFTRSRGADRLRLSHIHRLKSKVSIYAFLWCWCWSCWSHKIIRIRRASVPNSSPHLAITRTMAHAAFYIIIVLTSKEMRNTILYKRQDRKKHTHKHKASVSDICIVSYFMTIAQPPPSSSPLRAHHPHIETMLRLRGE